MGLWNPKRQQEILGKTSILEMTISCIEAFLLSLAQTFQQYDHKIYQTNRQFDTL